MKSCMGIIGSGLVACAAMLCGCPGPTPQDPGPGGTVDPALRAIAGLEFFSERGCAACHCNDAVGGCNLDAPSIQGVTRQRIDLMLRGSQSVRPHPLKMPASDQEIDDVATFLASLTPGARIQGHSQVTQGYGLYVRGGCIACHLASGQGANQGGLGVAIAGTDPDNIFSALSGAIPCHPLQREVPATPSPECRYDIETNETVEALVDTAPPDSDDERILLSYFLAFIAPPPSNGNVERCNKVSGQVCTVAGNGISGYTRDGVPATESLLFSPLELSLTDWNADGVLDLVIVDWNNHRVRAVYIDTVIGGVADRIESIAGTGKVTGSDALNHPTDVAFDADGALVMANWHNQNVYRYARGLENGGDRDQLAGLCDLICSDDSAGPTGVDETYLSLPSSVAIHPDGRVFIAEAGCSRIRVLTVGATRERQHPPQCITEVNLIPDGIIETLSGTAGMNGYAGDGGPAAGAIFNIDNSPLNPNFGIAFSPEDPPHKLYVADTKNNCIRYLDLTVDPPTVHLLAGVPASAGYKDGPAAEALFNFPTNVYVHSDGALYIADARNHAIRRIDPESKTVTTIAGTGHRGFNGDNIEADKTLFDSPGGVVIHPDGRIFIADLGNNRVRVIYP